ncbi:MAG: phosphonate C-P lyase system protein PhnG [Magnetovibrio sp.]|nr:phosphonate C-P lyase system protein PhnG [Magnetovibrio sp.]
MTEVNSEIAQRQNWMSLLARGDVEHFERTWSGIDLKPDYDVLRAADTGMVMVRGRAGGDGQRFNLGEMTVTRCSVRMRNGIIGHAYLAGRNKRQATLAAIFDAMLQAPGCLDTFKASLLDPIQDALAKKQSNTDRKVASTRVNFFTMVRGDD